MHRPDLVGCPRCFGACETVLSVSVCLLCDTAGKVPVALAVEYTLAPPTPFAEGRSLAESVVEFRECMAAMRRRHGLASSYVANPWAEVERARTKTRTTRAKPVG